MKSQPAHSPAPSDAAPRNGWIPVAPNCQGSMQLWNLLLPVLVWRIFCVTKVKRSEQRKKKSHLDIDVSKNRGTGTPKSSGFPEKTIHFEKTNYFWKLYTKSVFYWNLPKGVASTLTSYKLDFTNKRIHRSIPSNRMLSWNHPKFP